MERAARLNQAGRNCDLLNLFLKNTFDSFLWFYLIFINCHLFLFILFAKFYWQYFVLFVFFCLIGRRLLVLLFAFIAFSIRFLWSTHYELSTCSTYVHNLFLSQTRWVHTDTLWQHCPAARSRRCIWNHMWPHSCLRHFHTSYNRCLGEIVGCSGALHSKMSTFKKQNVRKHGRQEGNIKGKKKIGR